MILALDTVPEVAGLPDAVSAGFVAYVSAEVQRRFAEVHVVAFGVLVFFAGWPL